MKVFIVLLLFSSVHYAWALKVGVEMNFACVGIDGAPITNDSSLAADCCVGGSLKPGAPDQCRAGFNSIGIGAAASGQVHLHTAQQELQQASGMSSVGTDLEDHPTAPAVAAAQGEAMTADSGKSRAVNAGVDVSTQGSSKGALGGGPAAGAGGSGSLSFDGFHGDTKPLADSQEQAADLAAGKYKQNGAGSSDKKGSGFSFDLFGKNDKGSKSGADGSLKFGANGSGKGSDSGSGANEDASDYLSRIGKGDDIFKVVSRRYVKETIRKSIDPIEKLSAE